MKIPFCLLPPAALEGFSRPFYNAGGFTASLFPSLAMHLDQAEATWTEREYAAKVLASSTLNAALVAFGLLGVGILARVPLLPFALVAAFLLFTASLFTGMVYPQLLAQQRARRIEQHLIPALRQLVIEIKSGVPLFNAMASLTVDYQEVSHEFHKIVRRINAGTSELDALTDVSAQSPSLAFRQLLWQLSNALKVGGDVAAVLENLVDDLTRERMDQIRKYGQELSPWAMMYMMLAVIVPSLGMTMLLVIASFASIQIPSIALAGMVVFLAGFQLFFMSFVASRRPAV